MRLSDQLEPALTSRATVRWGDYLAVARLDHWFKNLFMLPGLAAAVIATQEPWDLALLSNLVPAFWAACCVASFNYIVNEILDAPTDIAHPQKKYRPIPSGRVRIPPLLLMAAAFLAHGMTVATAQFSEPFVISLAALAIMGVVYNLPPIRAKDVPYLDALCESINNPIRLCIGWFAVGVSIWPPISLLVAYWAFGALLMTGKRYAEYAAIGDQLTAGRYRKSFRGYTPEWLLVAMMVYACGFVSVFTIFAAKYKAEMLLGVPLLVVFVGWFFHVTLKRDSVVQEPERLVHQPRLIFFCLAILATLVVLATVDLPPVRHWLSAPSVTW